MVCYSILFTFTIGQAKPFLNAWQLHIPFKFYFIWNVSGHMIMSIDLGLIILFGHEKCWSNGGYYQLFFSERKSKWSVMTPKMDGCKKWGMVEETKESKQKNKKESKEIKEWSRQIILK